MNPESLVRDTDNLFSLPDVALRVNQLIEDPETCSERLAEVILCDPALSARLLRLVNSAFYARSHAIDTVSQAINIIGYRALRDLVVATYAVDMFKGLPREKINMERFWLRGVACGIAARELAGHLRLHDGERFFIAGLLHGLGELVFFSQCPNTYLQVLALMEEDRTLSVAEAEQQVFGFNYAELGGALLREWRFPDSIWKVVAHHLTPAKADDANREAVNILHAAELVARVVQVTSCDGRRALTEDIPLAMQTAEQQLTLKPGFLNEMPSNIGIQVFEMFEILVPGAGIVY
jgi:HD-like signal output (HDOD) protein